MVSGHVVAPTARRMPARGNAPGSCPHIVTRPERAEGFLRPFRAHNILMGSETQGVALGWYPAALSAPQDMDLVVPWLNRCGRKCMRKATHKVHVSSSQIDSAMARARQFEASDPRVIRVQYEAKLDLVSLHFADGLRVSIPRKHLQGLESANQSQLSKIEIVGNGTGLHWPLLDVDHYVLGLLQHRFGTKRWMNEIGRRGGLVKSEAKTKAARRNGLKGGRPRLSALQNTRR
jgi:uncharacterized protein DUF2442